MSVVRHRNADRPYDIIVWGATGFTGALVAEYLAVHAPKDVKFAIAGRNKEKLAKVTARIVKMSPTRNDVPVIIADIQDEASLDAMVSKTRVLISTAGPFYLHGFAVVAACVRNKTDYIDSTGEPPFTRRVIDEHHEKAKADGTLIIPSCGFDSIPSDLGAFMIADHFAKQGRHTASVHMSVAEMKGVASGGTVASLLGVLTETPYKEQVKMMDPYYLCPSGDHTAKGPDSMVPGMLHYSHDHAKWQSYFVMESTNSRYVRRSNHLLGNAYGPSFSYLETQSQSNVLVAAVAAGVTVAAGAALVVPPVQWVVSYLANKFVPAGSGPSDEQIRTGHFTTRSIGHAVKKDGEEGQTRAVVTVKGVQDPGYGETAKMLSESALCLALDRNLLADVKKAGSFAGRVTGGVVTASTAMGLVLVDRLRKAGMTFEVKDM
ncbi:hypothetical protein HKX48_006651 [Thoreauomyces humboldtii]|nr:hypothetical protein HKX48_006651 [Thoreauomyces humboldtii]